MYSHQMYVRPEPQGDDANDGLSWDTAKRTVMAAYDAIPGGDIFIGSELSSVGAPIGVHAQTDPGAGIWITEDPEVVSRDPRWRWPKPVRFIGAGPCRSQFGHPAAYIDVKNVVPSIWLWDTAESNYFQDLIVNRPIWIGIAPEYWGIIGHEHGNFWGNVQSRAAFEIGSDERTRKHVRGSVALARFIRVVEGHPAYFYEPVFNADGSISTTEVLANGERRERRPSFVRVPRAGVADGWLDTNHIEPSLVIGNAFWLWFDQCRFTTTTGVTNEMYGALAAALPGQFRIGDDERAVILIRPDSKTTALSDPDPLVEPENKPLSTAGLLFFEDLITSGGHVVFYGSHNGGSLSMRDGVFESDNALAIGSPLLIRGQVGRRDLAYPARIELRNCNGADIPGGALVPDVWIQARVPPDQIVVDGSVRSLGPCTVIGNQYLTEQGTSAEAEGQVGFWAGGRIAGVHDAARRVFSMAALPLRNLLNPTPTWHRGLSIPGEYSHHPTVTIQTTGIKGPDGAARAFRVRRDAGTEDYSAFVFVRTEELRAGMRLVVAGWVRASEYETSPPHIQFAFNGYEGHHLRFRETETNYVSIFGARNRWTFARFAGTLEGDDEALHSGDLMLQLAAPYQRAGHPEAPYCDFSDLFYTKIRPGEFTDHEFAEVITHMVSLPGNVEPGTLTTLSNQDAMFQGRVTHQSHVAYSGALPVCRPAVAAGVSAVAKIKGNDVCGIIKLVTGDGPRVGAVVQVNFEKRFFSDPLVSVSPINQQAAIASLYATAGVTGFSILAAHPLSPRQEYLWNYHVMGLDKP